MTFKKLIILIRDPKLRRSLTFVFVGLAVVFGFLTYAKLTEWPPSQSNVRNAIILLYIDLALLLCIGGLVGQHLIKLVMQRRKGAAGAKLQVRMIGFFTLLVMTPTIIVAVFSAIFFNLGIEVWFNERVQKALSSSRAISQAYLVEHQKTIQADILSMANDINHIASLSKTNPIRFQEIFSNLARSKSLPEAILFNSRGVIARSSISFLLEYDVVPIENLKKANQGEIVVITGEDRVRAMVKLNFFFDDVYLYVGRIVDPLVLNYISETEAAVLEYEQMEGRRGQLQFIFSCVFVVSALLLLLACVWTGLLFGVRLTEPISLLISAAEQIKEGVLSTRVPVSKREDEIQILSRTFNNMANKIENQQIRLLETNEKLVERRRFTEAVLKGVSAGVIGLDDKGNIDLPNRKASELLEFDLSSLKGEPLWKHFPEIRPLLRLARRRTEEGIETQIDASQGNKLKKFLVRISVETDKDKIKGYVVTFDDISELVSAQRKSAWADVARRIAHEIKNPLTPIQLSAERLKRKYISQIHDDQKSFLDCTDTIIRQVGDIEKMVDAFSSFARLPNPSIEKHDLKKICEHILLLFENANPHIIFHKNLPQQTLEIFCDDRLIRQALTNILQNAVHAIEERHDFVENEDKIIGFIVTDVGKDVTIEIHDNGIGLPKEGRKAITEPYVTTKSKGTGLGLAIVQRIMEDHNAELQFSDNKGHGAVVTMKLPKHKYSIEKA